MNSEKSWPFRKYGPSNWMDRPARLQMTCLTLDTEDKRAYIRMCIWRAVDLYDTQTLNAFMDGESSPDAIMGLRNFIRNLRLPQHRLDGCNTDEIVRLDPRAVPLFAWAMRHADSVPSDYLKQHAHPAIMEQGLTGASIFKFLEANGFLFLRMTEYCWENAERLLRVTAQYLDEMNRRYYVMPDRQNPNSSRPYMN